MSERNEDGIRVWRRGGEKDDGMRMREKVEGEKRRGE